MSQPPASKRSKRSNRHSYENKSTQTERQRPSNPTPTINGSVILKITDYTKLEEDGHTSVEETSMSETSSQSSAQSRTRRRGKGLISVTNCASQTEKEWRKSILDAYESASDSEDTDRMYATSYDYLEGERLVTSLAELPLSDNDEDQRPREVARNEEKLAKFF